jgi:F0F1-type ATP synthase assembly protein I
MREKKGSEQGVGAGYRYASLGLAFAGGILLFMAAGYALDRWLGSLPWLTLVGTLAGAVLSFLSVYRRLMADEARDKRERAAK